MQTVNEGVWVSLPVASLKKADYRHPPFGPEYRPFFKRCCRVLGEVFPGTPDDWEDDFRRDAHPEREMGLWKDFCDIYEHFTRQGQGWDLDRKRELFGVLLTCLSEGPKAALREPLQHLARRQVKDIVSYATQATNGKVRPIVVS